MSPDIPLAYSRLDGGRRKSINAAPMSVCTYGSSPRVRGRGPSAASGLASTNRVHSHLSPCLGRDPGGPTTPERPATSWPRSTGAHSPGAPAPARSSRAAAAGRSADDSVRCSKTSRSADTRFWIHSSDGTRKTDSRECSSACTSTVRSSTKASVSARVLASAWLASALPQAMKSTIRVTRRRASASCATFPESRSGTSRTGLPG